MVKHIRWWYITLLLFFSWKSPPPSTLHPPHPIWTVCFLSLSPQIILCYPRLIRELDGKGITTRLSRAGLPQLGGWTSLSYWRIIRSAKKKSEKLRAKETMSLLKVSSEQHPVLPGNHHLHSGCKSNDLTIIKQMLVPNIILRHFWWEENNLW